MNSDDVAVLRDRLNEMGAVLVERQADGPFINEVFETADVRFRLESEYGNWLVNVGYADDAPAPASFWLEALDGRVDMPVPVSTDEDMSRLIARLPDVIAEAPRLAAPVRTMVAQYRTQRTRELRGLDQG